MKSGRRNIACKTKYWILLYREHFLTFAKCFAILYHRTTVWCGPFYSHFKFILSLVYITTVIISLKNCVLQHTSADGYTEPHVQPTKSSSRQNIPRCRNSITSTNEDHPHIGNYRLLKTIGKGNFAKVKLARHVLTGREVSFLSLWKVSHVDFILVWLFAVTSLII